MNFQAEKTNGIVDLVDFSDGHTVQGLVFIQGDLVSDISFFLFPFPFSLKGLYFLLLLLCFACLVAFFGGTLTLEVRPRKQVGT